MVSVEEVEEEKAPVVEEMILPSRERELDAEEIEGAASTMKRPSARMHLEALAKKLRKESEALKRVEKSKGAAESQTTLPTSSETLQQSENKAASVAAPPSTTNAPHKVVTPGAAGVVAPPGMFSPIDRFSFDAGGYNSAFVSVYVPLPGVGSISRDLVACDFTTTSFDLVVRDLKGKSYRLCKDDLEKDIDPSKSKIVVKAEKVVIKLAKVKQGEYGGYDYWSKLTDSKGRKKGSGGKADNPQASIMQMMKDMYDEGDDNMKKIIGETMLKQQRGELNKDGGMGGLGDMGGLSGDMGGLGGNLDDEDF